MAIPSGSGSERLRRATLNDNTSWGEIISGTALHIYTIISIIGCNRTSSANLMSIRMNDGTNDIGLVEGLSVPSYGTLTFTDKFVLEEDDDLDIYSVGASDWIVSFIDQNWEN